MTVVPFDTFTHTVAFSFITCLKVIALTLLTMHLSASMLARMIAKEDGVIYCTKSSFFARLLGYLSRFIRGFLLINPR
jgi:hypothetical protein